MASSDDTQKRPSGVVSAAFGVLAVVAMAAMAFRFAPTGGGTRARVAQDEAAPLIGFAPSAPAAGSMLRYETEYPTIPYLTGKRTDAVAALIERLERGEVELVYDGERGYLDSLLAALDIDPASQTLVYSQRRSGHPGHVARHPGAWRYRRQRVGSLSEGGQEHVLCPPG
jgi:hypothetical protein